MGSPYGTSEGQVEGYPTVVLRSENAGVEAAFAPQAGMLGYSLMHEGEELLDLGEGVERYVREGKTAGIPFLHPWANRLSGFGYSAGGREVALDRGSQLVKCDPNGLPIHGLLNGSPHWNLIESTADEGSARLSAALDFAAHDDLLAAFPFPHRVEIAARLEAATLTIETSVTATGDVAVPISFGYHPYVRIPGVEREKWEVALPVRSRLVLDERMIPTGEKEAFSFPDKHLGERSFDDGFADLAPGEPFTVSAGKHRIEIAFGEDYPFAQVYAPPDKQFICFEPMTAPTNALVSGADLPAVQPSATFRAVFSISVSYSA
jgi:galactose mutarotase-like enzyme